MRTTHLPSGRLIKHISSVKSKEQDKDTTPTKSMEATAGAMSLDVEGQCPKCNSMMGSAIASGESIHYCIACRVSLPLRSN